MQCSKCGQQNKDSVQYCVRCHTPTRYNCPKCKHVQAQGGSCEQCGLDFAKHAAAILFQAQSQASQDRSKATKQYSLLRHVLLAVLTGGLSFLWLLRSNSK